MAEKTRKCSFADYFYLEDVKRCRFFELLWFSNDANRHSFVVHSFVTDYTSDKKKKKTWLGLQENGDWLQSTQLHRRRLNTEKSPASLSVNFAGELASSNPQVCVCVWLCWALGFPLAAERFAGWGFGSKYCIIYLQLVHKKTFKTGHTFEITNI